MSRFPDIEHSSRFLLREVHADFPHYFDRQRMDGSGLDPATVRLKFISAKLIDPGLGNQAAEAVMHANEQDLFLFHNSRPILGRTILRPIFALDLHEPKKHDAQHNGTQGDGKGAVGFPSGAETNQANGEDDRP